MESKNDISFNTTANKSNPSQQSEENDDLLKQIQERILKIRGKKVLIDRDLASLYHIETKRLNEQVKRNHDRFPESFRFQLTTEEKNELVANCDRLKTLKNSAVATYAYTELGVAMLTSVLKGKDTISTSIRIIESIVSFSAKVNEKQGRIDTLNHLYWKEWTIKTSRNYSKEFLRLSSDYHQFKLEKFKSDVKKYLSKVIDYHKQGILKQKLDELEQICIFPKDIRGVIHEYSGFAKFQPTHLMCKVATIRDDIHSLTYEFLIEYGLLESDVDIYYGVKAISDFESTSEEFLSYVKAVSGKWFSRISGKDKKDKKDEKDKKGGFSRDTRFYKRHKFTNNASDGTFWISWVRMESNETLERALKNLESKIYNKFIRFLEDSESISARILTLRFPELFDTLGKNIAPSNNESPEGVKPEDLKEDAKRVLKVIDKATQWTYRNGKNSPCMFKRLPEGRYHSYMDRDETRIFIEILYNREYVEWEIKLHEKYEKHKKAIDSKQLINAGITNAYSYFDKMKEYVKGISQYGETIAEMNEELNPTSNIFKYPKLKEYKELIKQSKPRKIQVGFFQVIEKLRDKNGPYDKDFRKSLDYSNEKTREKIITLLDDFKRREREG